MLSNNLRAYSRISRTIPLHSHLCYNSSTLSKTGMETLADWEYVTKIQQLLKENNVNEALKYLVNSHLYGKVLDRHIFRQYYVRVQQNEMPISYEQVAYRLYRTHFKPHILILDWMNSLARSNSPTLLQLLKEDFNSLKLEMPNVEKVNEDKEDTRMIQNWKNIVKVQQTKPQSQSSSTTIAMNPKTVQQPSQQQQQQQSKMKNGSQQQQQISQLSRQHLGDLARRLATSLSSLSSTVTLHDIDIKYHNVNETQTIRQMDLDKFMAGESLPSQEITHNNINNQDNNNHYLDDDEVYEDEGEDEYQEMWERVERIKIGRIEIKMIGNVEQASSHEEPVQIKKQEGHNKIVPQKQKQKSMQTLSQKMTKSSTQAQTQGKHKEKKDNDNASANDSKKDKKPQV